MYINTYIPTYLPSYLSVLPSASDILPPIRSHLALIKVNIDIQHSQLKGTMRLNFFIHGINSLHISKTLYF